MSFAALDSRNRALALVHFIGTRKATYVEEMVRHGFVKSTVYRIVPPLVAAGIIELSYEPSEKSGGVKVMHRLTPKGIEIFNHLDAIQRILHQGRQ